MVEVEERDDASDSSAPSAVRENKPDTVVLVLFFFGSGGRTFPGSSFRSCLCRSAKSR